MAKAKAGAATPADVLPAELPETALVNQDSLTITGFINGLIPFMRTAQQLETKARETLTKARTFMLPKPGDVDGDAALQTFIRSASADKKAVEKHWDITSAIYQFHKKLVAARTRPTSMLDEAQETAQRLHNTFVADAKRRADAENERLRADEARVAQEARDRELARLENEALERDAASEELSERELKFVAGITAGQDEHRAAFNAGYAQPRTQAIKLMNTGKILAAIKATLDAAEIRRQATAVKETPLDISRAPEVKPELLKAGTDRTTHSAEITNERLLIEAIVGGQHGIPLDLLQINQAKLSEYARSLHTLIDRWPGVRYKKTTRTV